MIETSDHQENAEPAGPERACAYRVLRYTPNLVRDEWVNIGVLLFDPQTGERRLRMIEEEDEFRRVRRLHPGADELLSVRFAMIWKTGFNRHPPSAGRAKPAIGSTPGQVG